MLFAMLRPIFASALLLALLTEASLADSPLTGTLLATSACPALVSIKKSTNPGDVSLTPQQTYKVVAANKPQPSHYLVLVPGADPQRRWVAVDCGTLTADAGTTAAPTPAVAGSSGAAKATAAQPGSPHFYVFAISWEPAFCQSKPAKPECASESADRFDASHFSLHGLWPDPSEYCGVDAVDVSADKAGHWKDLPAITLDVDTRTALDKAMPGTQSQLERHEWIKHGTCSGTAMSAYFASALHLLDAINASPVQALFAQNIGKSLSQQEIRAAFDKAFGTDAGQRTRISCEGNGNQRLITEITIGLYGSITPQSDPAALIAAARPTKGGCDSGLVDAVGG